MTTVLTTNLVLQKTKLNHLSHVKRLNACGVQVNNIDVLRDTHNIEVLSLSVNQIHDINALSNCCNLRELFLRKNEINDIRQVLHLSQLDSLQNLGLSENAICDDPSYRLFVIAAVPSLAKLDDVEITPAERAAARRTFPDLHLMRPPTPTPIEQGSPLGQTNRGNTPTSQQMSTPSKVQRSSFPDEDDFVPAIRSVRARQEVVLQPARDEASWDDVPVGGRPPRRAVKPVVPVTRHQDPFSAPVPNRGMESPPPRSHPSKFHGSTPQPVHNYASSPSSPAAAARREGGASPTTSQKMNALEDAAIEAVKALLSNMSPFALTEIRIHLDGLQNSNKGRVD